ncbi:thermonuclease family protein [bacterium]|nr:thermonuclease family protein [bacterium]
MKALLKPINLLIKVITVPVLVCLVTSYAYGVVDIFEGKEGCIKGKYCKVKFIKVVTPEKIIVKRGLKEHSVKLAGVNVPKEYWPEATTFIRSFIEGIVKHPYITVEFEKTKKEKAWVGYVWKEGLMLNWELVRMGLAEYCQKDITGNKYDQFLQGAELKAKTERKGMWAKILRGGM